MMTGYAGGVTGDVETISDDAGTVTDQPGTPSDESGSATEHVGSALDDREGVRFWREGRRPDREARRKSREARWKIGKAVGFVGKRDGRPGSASESSGRALEKPGSPMISSGRASDEGGRVKIDREARRNVGKDVETTGKGDGLAGNRVGRAKNLKIVENPDFTPPTPLPVYKKRQRMQAGHGFHELTLRPIPPVFWPKTRRAWLLLLGEKAGLREVVTHISMDGGGNVELSALGFSDVHSAQSSFINFQ